MASKQVPQNSLQTATSTINSMKRTIINSSYGLFGRSFSSNFLNDAEHNVFKDINFKKYSLTAKSIFIKKAKHFLDLNVRSGDFIIPTDKRLAKIFRTEYEAFLVLDLTYSVHNGKNVSVDFTLRSLEYAPKYRLFYFLQEGIKEADEMMQIITDFVKAEDDYGDLDGDGLDMDRVLEWIDKNKEKIHPKYNDIIPGLLLLKEMR